MTSTTVSAHPIQLRLPGQSAAPGGPVDPFMMYAMHHAFRRDLNSFAPAVPNTPLDDRATWRALDARWIAFSEVLHHHHTAEDTHLWPYLLEHTPPTEAAVLHAMSAEHGEIDPLLDACGTGFAALAHTPDGSARDTLTDNVLAARDCLAEHLSHEESGAMAVVQRVLTHARWEELEKNFSADYGPTAIFKVAPWILKGLDDGDRALILARVPLPVRLIAAATRRGFARSELRAFKYAGE